MPLLLFIFICLLLPRPAHSARNVQLVALKATKSPCCLDTLLPGVCKAMYNRDHEKFSTMCRTNPDFSFVQCCQSCHFNADMFTAMSYPVPADLYMYDVANLLETPNPTCVDRRAETFCDHLVTRRGHWQQSRINCQSSALAFRVCRKSCGFCASTRNVTVMYDSAVARNPKLCARLT